MAGVLFGELHSERDFGVVREYKEIGEPKVRTETLEVPGMDGVLDYTEFAGEPKYGNRTVSFVFSSVKSREAFGEVFAKMLNGLHGQRMKIVLDEEPEWYYEGRVSVSRWKANELLHQITVDCDCFPYRYKATETVKEVALTEAGQEIVLSNTRMRVVPKVTVSGNATVSFADGAFSYELGTGSFVLPELVLNAGETRVTAAGSGTITFSYREGSL